MVGWHHRLDGHEFEQALGVGDGQGGLVRYGPWGQKESDTTERLNNSDQWLKLCFHCRGEGSVPDWKTKIPAAAWLENKTNQ